MLVSSPGESQTLTLYQPVESAGIVNELPNLQKHSNQLNDPINDIVVVAKVEPVTEKSRRINFSTNSPTPADCMKSLTDITPNDTVSSTTEASNAPQIPPTDKTVDLETSSLPTVDDLASQGNALSDTFSSSQVDDLLSGITETTQINSTPASESSTEAGPSSFSFNDLPGIFYKDNVSTTSVPEDAPPTEVPGVVYKIDALDSNSTADPPSNLLQVLYDLVPSSTVRQVSITDQNSFAVTPTVNYAADFGATTPGSRESTDNTKVTSTTPGPDKPTSFGVPFEPTTTTVGPEPNLMDLISRLRETYATTPTPDNSLDDGSSTTEPFSSTTLSDQTPDPFETSSVPFDIIQQDQQDSTSTLTSNQFSTTPFDTTQDQQSSTSTEANDSEVSTAPDDESSTQTSVDSLITRLMSIAARVFPEMQFVLDSMPVDGSQTDVDNVTNDPSEIDVTLQSTNDEMVESTTLTETTLTTAVTNPPPTVSDVSGVTEFLTPFQETTPAIAQTTAETDSSTQAFPTTFDPNLSPSNVPPGDSVTDNLIINGDADPSTTMNMPVASTTSATTATTQGNLALTTQNAGRFGTSRLTPAPRFTSSSSTVTPLRDYAVYGIFPNRTIVRKPGYDLSDPKQVYESLLSSIRAQDAMSAPLATPGRAMVPAQFDRTPMTSQPISSTTTSTTTLRPLRDYSVYGVYPNRTIVRKRPEDNLIDPTTVDSPYVIFGIYPDGRLVRKFPNGTTIPDPPTERAEVVFEPPTSSTTTTTTTTTTTSTTPASVATNRLFNSQSTQMSSNQSTVFYNTPKPVGGLDSQGGLFGSNDVDSNSIGTAGSTNPNTPTSGSSGSTGSSSQQTVLIYPCQINYQNTHIYFQPSL